MELGAISNINHYPFQDFLTTPELIDITLNKQKYLASLFFRIFQEGIFIYPQDEWHLRRYKRDRGSDPPRSSPSCNINLA
jgi:hypothetical protein